MANAQPSGSGSSSAGASQEYAVRVPKDMNKKHSILKFHHSLKIDLTKSGPLKMERENNLKDYKLSYNMEAQPKFGAGSEFGKDQRDEARRKKYGIYRKKYNPENQPWLMKLGEPKQAKRFKGTKEGGISENVSYFVFTQCPDGAFDAFPVDDWYHFTPQAKYKCLTSEEAEEEFTRRDRTMNFFSIMVKKRMTKEEEDDDDEKEKKVTKGKKKKDFLLTDLDEWAVLSDGDVEGGSDGEPEIEEGAEKPKKDKKGKQKKGQKKSMRKNSDDEALEESDSFDEGNEVDYMTDSESNDEGMFDEKDRDDDNMYKEKGVEDEDGLKKLMNSDDEDEEENKNEEELDEDSKDGSNKDKEKKDDSDSESSDSSGSDSDPEKDVNFSSALFMQKKTVDKKTEKKKIADRESRSRSATPTEEKAKKRKAETDSPVPKKIKIDTTSASSTLTQSSSSASLASEGISEEAVRRYLLRKPMTTKDLVQKFKNTGLSKDQLVNTIAKILKRIDPEKTKMRDKLYLSIRKKDS